MEKGIFISLEGILGSGKSEQAKLLAQKLSDQGREVLLTREPGGTRAGEEIREVLLHTRGLGILPKAEFFLFAASRAQLVEEEIIQGLKEGKIVISDRFGDSSEAFQGFGKGVSLSLIKSVNLQATSAYWPDLTILYDLEVSFGIERKKKCDDIDRLDKYDPEFHQKVRDGYLQMAANDPQRWRVIDGSGSIKELHRATMVTVNDFLQGRNKEGAFQMSKERSF